MKFPLAILFCVTLILESSWPAPSRASDAGAASTPNTPPTVVFRLATKVASNASVSVLHGATAHALDWQALLETDITQIRANGRSYTSTCSATLVGPRVLLTAAHCVDGGAGQPLKTVQLQLDGATVETSCTISPVYTSMPENEPAARDSSDFALCLLANDLQKNPNYRSLKYEVIDTEAVLKRTDPVLVIGYGCASIVFDAQGNWSFGKGLNSLQAGDASISGTTGATSIKDRDYLQTHSINDNEAALCPGDSGGPLMTGVTSAHQVGARQIVGVNSTLLVAGPGDYTSRFASLATDDFRSFVGAWLAASGNPLVCGVNAPKNRFPCVH